jgi:hypothetical protein
MDGFRRVESSQTPARGPQFGPNVQSTIDKICLDLKDKYLRTKIFLRLLLIHIDLKADFGLMAENYVVP